MKSHSWADVALAAIVYGSDLTILGFTTYLVFWRDASGWWFALALLLCALMSPRQFERR